VLGFIGYLSIFGLIILLVAFFTESERKIPLQQTGKGLNLGESNTSFLPFKINPAGVIPVIFATAIITLPPTIAQLFPNSEGKQTVIDIFNLSHPFGLSIYALLIYAFTFFYAHISIDPEKLSDNFKKSNTFILGVKPGEDTTAYLRRTINNLCFFGATYLAFVSVVPYLLGFIMPSSLTIGGTQVIIMVSVALETQKELKARFKSQKISNKIRSDFEIKSLKQEKDAGEKSSVI
jgi:preprotein translocase subunit SecY